MRRSLIALLLPLLLAAWCRGDDAPKLMAASEWCKPVESHDRFLQARWLLMEGRSRAYAGPGSEVLLYDVPSAAGVGRPRIRASWDAQRWRMSSERVDLVLIPAA